MEDYERALYLEEAALNSAGYATQKLDIYLTGIDARIQDITNTWKEFGKELVSSDFVKFFISAGKTILQGLMGIIRFFETGFGKITLAVLGTITTFLIFKRTVDTFYSLGSKIVTSFSAISGSAMQTATATLQATLANKSLTRAQREVARATYEAAAAQATYQAALGWISLVLTAIAAAITLIIGLVRKQKQAQKEYVESLKTQYNETLESIENTQNQISSLEMLSKQLENTGGDVSKMADMQEDLSKALGRTVNVIDQQKNSYKALSAELIIAIEAQKQIEKSLLTQRKLQAEVLLNNTKMPKAPERGKVYYKAQRGFQQELAGTLDYSINIASEKAYEEEVSALEKDLAKYEKKGLDTEASITKSRIAKVKAAREDYLSGEGAKFEAQYQGYIQSVLDRTKDIASIYGSEVTAEIAKDFKDDEGLSLVLAENLNNIINRAITEAGSTEERESIIDAITPRLKELDIQYKKYAEQGGEYLATGSEEARQSAEQTLTAIENIFTELGDGYEYLAPLLKDLLSSASMLLTMEPDTQKGVVEFRAAVNDQIKDLEKLEEQYKSLASAQQTYFDSRKNMLKQFGDLTLEQQRSVLGYSVDTATGEITQKAPDYTAIEDNETVRILQELDNLYNQYQSDINNLTEDQVLQNEELTNEYDRQVKMLEKQFAINQKNLEIQKAQIKLANAEAERNTRMFINGQWIWAANPETVASAQQDVGKLEQEKIQAQIDAELQTQLDESIRLTEQMTATINFWEYLNEEMNANRMRIDEAFNSIAKEGDNLASVFHGILATILSSEEYGDLKSGIETLTGKTLPYDSGGSLGSVKGYFYKNTSQEEVVLNPKNTTAVKALLNRLPELEGIINKLMSGLLFATPQMGSSLQGQDNSGETYNINQLHVTYKGDNFLGIMHQAKTVAQTKV